MGALTVQIGRAQYTFSMETGELQSLHSMLVSQQF